MRVNEIFSLDSFPMEVMFDNESLEYRMGNDGKKFHKNKKRVINKKINIIAKEENNNDFE